MTAGNQETPCWRQRWRFRFARAWADAAGAAAVEFALVAPMVIALLLASSLVGVSFMAKSELDYATQRVARQLMVGQISSSSALQSGLCGYLSGLFDCSAVMINLNSYNSLASMQTAAPTLSYGASGAVTNGWSAHFGAAGSIMVLQVMYQFPLVSSSLFNFSTQANGSNLMVSTAVFVNE